MHVITSQYTYSKYNTHMHTHTYMIIHADVICATYEDLYAQKAAVICKLSIYVNDAHTHTHHAHVHTCT